MIPSERPARRDTKKEKKEEKEGDICMPVIRDINSTFSVQTLGKSCLYSFFFLNKMNVHKHS